MTMGRGGINRRHSTTDGRRQIRRGTHLRPIHRLQRELARFGSLRPWKRKTDVSQ